MTNTKCSLIKLRGDVERKKKQLERRIQFYE